LLHGLGRTSRSMSKMSRAMESAGYEVVNVSYPSTQGDMPELVGILENVLAQQCTDVSKRVHFVTHSLGGIIVRSYLDQQTFDRLGRVVMLAPPNGGSEIADTLKSWWPYQLAMGPMGQQLGTGREDLPRSLGAVDFDVGVITGDRSMNPLYSWWVKGRDDGKVSIRNARVPGMRDFLVVHSSHTFIMRRRQVIQQALAFLRDGQFAR
jgi:alpha-beta hydrolase superfamily lysophospholipase